MSSVGYATLQIIPSMRGVQSAIKRELGGIEGTLAADGDKAGRSWGSRFSGAVTGVAVKGLKTGGVAAGAFFGLSIAKGIGRLNAIEQAEAKLRGLGHSAVTVEQVMTNALASVKGTAFGLGEAGTVAATAVAAGVKPGQALEKYLKLTADAASIAGTSMGDMGNVLNNVTTLGAAYNDSLQILAQKGLPIYTWLADEMGITEAQVKKLASEGKVSSEVFQQAIEKNIGGAALESGNTTEGAFRNMGAAMSRFGAAIAGPVFKRAQGVFKGVIVGLDAMTARLAPAMQKISEAWEKDGFAGVVEVIRPQLAKVGSAIWEWLQVVIPEAARRLVDLGKTFAEFIIPRIPDFLKALGVFIGAAGTWMLETGLPYLWQKLIEWGVAFFKWVGPMIPPLLLELGKLLLALGVWILTEALPAIVANLLEWAWAFIKWIAPMIPQAIVELWKLQGRIAVWIVSEALPQIAEKLRGWAGAFVGWIATAVRELPGRLGELATRLITWISEMPGRITEASSGMWEGIKTAFKGALNWIIEKWNDLEFKLPSFKGLEVGGRQVIPGWEGPVLGTPNIPKMHNGGVVPGPLGQESLYLLTAKETVLPTHKPGFSMDGGGVHHHYHLDVTGSPVQVDEQELVKQLQRMELLHA